MFHMVGLVIPLVYFYGASVYPYWITQTRATVLLAAFTAFHWFLELLRILSPSFRQGFHHTFKGILRQDELNAATGVGYYLLGSLCAAALFPPAIAVVAVLFLIVGDTVAALFGIALGQTRIPGTHKSLEGFLACFVACFAISSIVFWDTPLFEYLAFCGALTASLVELAAPGGLDDNLTLPILSGLALHLVALRIAATTQQPFPLFFAPHHKPILFQ